jgi:hypothetical protein
MARELMVAPFLKRDEESTEEEIVRTLTGTPWPQRDRARWHGVWKSVEHDEHEAWSFRGPKSNERRGAPTEPTLAEADLSTVGDLLRQSLITYFAAFEAAVDLHSMQSHAHVGSVLQVAAEAFDELGSALVEASAPNLDGLFEVSDEEVWAFLRRKPHLVPVLRGIAAAVPDLFGAEARLRLQLVHDPEDGGAGELFVLVETSLLAEDALARLRAFDEGWWFDRLQTVGGEITVTLEYA